MGFVVVICIYFLFILFNKNMVRKMVCYFVRKLVGFIIKIKLKEKVIYIINVNLIYWVGIENNK